MLTYMKEQMKEQQAQSDRNREQTTFDRENVVREQEALRQLNDQLQAQISALQNNQSSTQSESEHEVGRSPDL